MTPQEDLVVVGLDSRSSNALPYVRNQFRIFPSRNVCPTTMKLTAMLSMRELVQEFRVPRSAN